MSRSDDGTTAFETADQSGVDGRLRDRVALVLLGDPWSLGWLLLVCAVGLLVGVRFYVETMAAVPTLLWPFYLDSPVAVALGALSLTTLLPFVAGDDTRPVTDVPTNRPLAYLHTLAFVWLVKYGLWPLVALNVRADRYLGAPGALWDYWAILVAHLLFVGLALLIPAYGRTTRGALAIALALVVANDVVDYAFGYHPPLRYDPGLLLPAATVALSLFAVGLASRSFDRLDRDDSSVVRS